MLLNILCLIGSVLSISMPPFGEVYSSQFRSRGFYFASPVDMWLVGVRLGEELGVGRSILDVIYINGVPKTFPEETSATSLFYYNRTDINSQYPNWICIKPTLYLSRNTFYGFLGGRVSDEETGNVSYSYSFTNEFTTQANENPITLYRLMNQQSIFNAKTTFVSTDREEPLARIELYVTYQEPTSLPNYCINIPPNPDDNPNITTTNQPNQEKNTSPASIISILF